jgi:hypothetical protein
MIQQARLAGSGETRLLTASIINLLSLFISIINLIYMDGLSDGWRASWHRGFEALVAEYEEKSNPVSGLLQALASHAA